MIGFKFRNRKRDKEKKLPGISSEILLVTPQYDLRAFVSPIAKLRINSLAILTQIPQDQIVDQAIELWANNRKISPAAREALKRHLVNKS